MAKKRLYIIDKRYPTRLGHQVNPEILKRIPRAKTPWYETEAEIQAKLRLGRKKARLLEWVRSQMILRLTPTERRCIELYFFENLTYRQAAARLGVRPSSVYRAVKRGIRKLREAARENPHLRL